MLSKISRYRKLPDEVTTTARGLVQAKGTRPLPEVSGIFQHTVVSSDRLDHLAYRYYKESRKWWRICDANPEFLSPQALLGKVPFVTVQLPITPPGATPFSWAALLARLRAQVGIQDAQLLESHTVTSEDKNIFGEVMKVYTEHAAYALQVTFNSTLMDVVALNKLIEGPSSAPTGFVTGVAEAVERVGKKIVVPPDVNV